MKTYTKKILALLLAIAMILQIVPSSVITTNAANTTDTENGTEVITDEARCIKYVWYEDVSEFRSSKPYNYPTDKEDYIFSGWFSETNDEKPIGESVTTGGAWAKFVLEDTLTVKGQINKKAAELQDVAGENVYFRLTTSVDSLNYNEVGLVVKMNGTTNTYSISTVYDKVTLVDDVHGNTIETPSNIFGKSAKHFATLQIGPIPGGDNKYFTTMDIDVQPYWITEDGTTVYGTARNKMLVSDERMNDTDGSNEDFVKDNNTYTHTTSVENKASYQYFKGGSDTVYLKGEYTPAGDSKFGISIRNGGETRQIFFSGAGFEIVDGVDDTGTITTSGVLGTDINIEYNAYTDITYTNEGVYVWAGKGTKDTVDNVTSVTATISAISTMLENKQTTEVIWAIENNVLYCSVAEKVVLRLPMEMLCDKWQDGRYYQLGVAGYNHNTIKEMTFTCTSLEYGKNAAECLIPEVAEMTTTKMAYEPITGSYMSASNASGYAYGTASNNTPIAIEMDVNWQVGTVAESYAGLDVKIGEETAQIIVKPLTTNATYKSSVIELSNRSWDGIDYLTEEFTANPLTKTADSFNLMAAIYDGKLSVLVDDVTAYEIALSDLISPYDDNADIQLGLATWDSHNGQAQFSNVTFYEGDAAIAEKTNNWTFYPEGYSTSTGTIKVDTGAGTAVGSSSKIKLSGTSEIWDIAGCMTNTTNALQGFEVATADGTKNVQIVRKMNGFAYSTNGGSSWSYTYQDSETDYTIKKQGRTDLGNYLLEDHFKVIIADDTLYGWFGNKSQLNWKIPLNNATFGGFAEGTEYNLFLLFGPQSTSTTVQDKFTINSVKNGIEIEKSLVNTLKSCENMDWKGANAMMTLSTEGQIVTMNTSGTGTRYVCGTSQDDVIWLSGTWELSGQGTDATGSQDMFGITLSDGTNSRQICFLHEGIQIMSGYAWSEVRPAWATKSIKDWDYVWGQYMEGEAYISPIGTMLNGTVGDKYDISFAIYQQTLYCSVDGNICLILPLSLLNNTNFPWNTAADATYKIGFTQWNPSANGHVAVSDVELTYGEEAEAKLDLSGIVNTTDNTSMVYSVLDGGYIPKFKSGFAGIYGDASTTVAVGTTVEWQDKKHAASAVGISVKTTDSTDALLSGELFVQGQNQQVRIQNNQSWDAIGTDSDSQPEYITAKVLEKVTPFGKDGSSEIVAKVQNDVLYVKYNGEVLDLDETDEIAGIPLNYLLGEDYTAGSSVQIGISTWDAHNGISIIKDLSFKTGTEAEDLYQGKRFEIDKTQVWTSNATTTMTYDEQAGTVTRTGNGFAGAYFEGTSQTWEVTGTMSQSDVDTLVNQGFTVSAITSDSTLVGTRFYMAYQGFATGGKNSENVETILNTDYNQPSKTIGVAGAAKYYVLKDCTRTHNTETQTMSDIRFRLVIANDILYLWLDDVLSWRIPLTTETFGNYEAGSSYQLGLAAINNSGTVTWKDLRVLSGADVDTSGITKFVVMDDNDRTNLIGGKSAGQSSGYDAVNGTWTSSTAGESRLFFVSSDTFASTKTTSGVNNGSTRWEIRGTMKNNASATQGLGFIVADENNLGIAVYGNNAGMIVAPAQAPWTNIVVHTTSAQAQASEYIHDYAQTLPFFANDASLRTKTEIDFRAMLLDGTLYVWFDGVLSWEYPLADSSVFGDDAATQAYSIGLVDRDASEAQFTNLTVKSGNEILTGEDFYMRDAFVLANSVETNETVEENGVTVSTEGVYYMYGTRYSGYFDVFTSYDLMTWEKQERCFTPDDNFWGDAGYYWAPEVYEYTYDGEQAYYMFATFTEMQSVTDEKGNTTSEIAKRGTAVLKADTPLGPFREWSDGPVTPIDQQCIDGTLYLEDNGDGTKTPYMIYCLEYTDEDAESTALLGKPIGLMCYIQLSDDLKTSEGNAVKMFNAKDASANRNESLERYVTDGPFAYTTSDGKLLLLWSTFIEGAELSTGYAADAWQYVQLQSKSGNGKLTDAIWTYDANAPILYGNATVKQGVYTADNFDGGHGMIFRTFDGQEKLIIHTPNLYPQHYGQGNCLERIKILDVSYNTETEYLKVN